MFTINLHSVQVPLNVLDESARGIVFKRYVESNFVLLSSPFNNFLKNIYLIFAKSLHTHSLQIAFSIPVSKKIFIFSTNSKNFRRILLGNRLT